MQHLVQGGSYADEGDVVRTALRILERQENDESPALESALLEGVRSPHRPYGPAVLESIRQAANEAEALAYEVDTAWWSRNRDRILSQ